MEVTTEFPLWKTGLIIVGGVAACVAASAVIMFATVGYEHSPFSYSSGEKFMINECKGIVTVGGKPEIKDVNLARHPYMGYTEVLINFDDVPMRKDAADQAAANEWGATCGYRYGELQIVIVYDFKKKTKMAWTPGGTIWNQLDDDMQPKGKAPARAL